MNAFPEDRHLARIARFQTDLLLTRGQPRRLAVSRRMHADPETVWRLLTDTTRWGEWGPSVRRVVCTERFIRKGSRGTVCTAVGPCVPFVITEYDHMVSWAWHVAGIPATGHRLVVHDPSACTVSFDMPWIWLPYTLICGRALSNIAGALARPSSTHVDSGNKSDERFRKAESI